MKSKMMTLAVATLAGTAFAQPGTFTDLGNRTTTQTFTQDVTLTAANDIQWFRMVLPPVGAATGWVDIWTSAPGDMTDTEIGLYDSTGLGAGSPTTYNDDARGPGLFSQLTFGSTVERTNLGNAALPRNGSDGSLAGGEYYLAVGRYAVTFAPAFVVTSTYTGTQRTTTLNFDIGAPTEPLPPTASGTATPNSAAPGDQVLYEVTVVPGANPTSTGVVVNGDLSGIGGPAAAVFHDDGLNGDSSAGDGVYSFTYTIPAATPGGGYSVAISVTDAQSRNASATIIGSVFNPVNLGTLTTDFTENNTVPPAAGLWYRFTLAEAVTVASGEFFDIDTNGSAIDTEIALFDDASGALIATNDDGGVGLDSLLTFGAGGGTAQTDGGSGSTGANGELAAGTYLLCLSQFNSVFADGPSATFPPAGAGGAVVLTITMGEPVPVITWDETADGGGDAGNTLETVQVVTGTGPLDRITGSFEGVDFDIYQINICDFASFSATTQGSLNNPDTQLFLFDSAGMAIAFNDDAAGVGYSTIDSSLVTANGTYLLCVSRYDNDPVDSGGNEFWLDQPFAGVRAPDGPGVGNPLAGSNGANAAVGTYQINLVGACYSGAAGPCSIADVGVAGGLPGQDNLLDNNDFIAFINYFFAANPIADMGIAGGLPGSDGAWDNNDFIAFINHFFEDSAACNG